MNSQMGDSSVWPIDASVATTRPPEENAGGQVSWEAPPALPLAFEGYFASLQERCGDSAYLDMGATSVPSASDQWSVGRRDVTVAVESGAIRRGGSISSGGMPPLPPVLFAPPPALPRGLNPPAPPECPPRPEPAEPPEPLASPLPPDPFASMGGCGKSTSTQPPKYIATRSRLKVQMRLRVVEFMRVSKARFSVHQDPSRTIPPPRADASGAMPSRLTADSCTWEISTMTQPPITAAVPIPAIAQPTRLWLLAE